MILGPPTGYIDMLDEATTAYLEKEVESGRAYQKSPIRPSAAGKCARELFYELMEYSERAKYPPDIKEPNVHRLLNLGHSVEYHLLRQFELLKGVFDIRYKQQVLSFAYLKAEKDPKLSQWFEGSLDLVLWSEKYKCVADVKSKKDGFVAPYKTRWDKLSEQLDEMETVEAISDQAFWVEDLPAFLEELDDPFFSANFVQLNLYANSDFLKQRGVDHGAILQYCKNDSRLREVRFKPSWELYEKTVGKMQNVITAVDTDNPELAPKEYEAGSFKCNYCRFRRTCWPNIKGRVSKPRKKE